MCGLCCSTDKDKKDDSQDDIKAEKPIAYKCLPYTTQQQTIQQQPLYHDSMSHQIPAYYSASRSPTLINQ